MGMDKDMKKLVRAARKRGWQLLQGKHFILQHPSGRKVAFSRTPSDRNAYLNLERDIARIDAEEKGTIVCSTTRDAPGVAAVEASVAVVRATVFTAAVPVTSRRRRLATAAPPTSPTSPSPAWPEPLASLGALARKR